MEPNATANSHPVDTFCPLGFPLVARFPDRHAQQPAGRLLSKPATFRDNQGIHGVHPGLCHALAQVSFLSDFGTKLNLPASAASASARRPEAVM